MRINAKPVMNAVVPGGGIEPPTRGFSIQCYPIKIKRIACKPLVEEPGTKGDPVNCGQIINAALCGTNHDLHTPTVSKENAK